MHRFVATMMVALLAGAGVAPCRPGLADERDPFSASDAGMKAPPRPSASAALSIAPATPAAPLSATARVFVAFDPLDAGRPADRALRRAVVVKSAPTILRV